jgi:hypothetical protein
LFEVFRFDELVLVLVCVASGGCGSTVNTSAAVGGTPREASVDPYVGLCPQFPPTPGGGCDGGMEGLRCLYGATTSSPNTYVYSCPPDGGWLPGELIGACEGYSGALEINDNWECVAECIADDGGKCCTCDPVSMLLTTCSSCESNGGW